MKKFYGGIFMDKDLLKEMGITYPIKLEYYKIEEESKLRQGKESYGVEVVKTEYLEETVNIETQTVSNISYDEHETNKILELLKLNQVTPVITKDVVDDLLYTQNPISL